KAAIPSSSHNISTFKTEILFSCKIDVLFLYFISGFINFVQKVIKVKPDHYNRLLKVSRSAGNRTQVRSSGGSSDILYTTDLHMEIFKFEENLNQLTG